MMTNQDLFDAIAFTYQHCQAASGNYAVSEKEKNVCMLQHLKDLLAIQLERAKHESSDRVPR